jgi:4-amino-4-deoxy-L-arabinose transferase-like glycosyltransferase
MKPISIFHNIIHGFIGQNNKSEKLHFLLATTKYIVYHERSLQILALCVVLLLAMPVFSLGEGTIPGDSFDYLELGRNIAVNKQYIASTDSHLFQTSYSRVPLFSILFAISFMVFEPSISSALIITKVAYFFSVIFIYLIARKLFNFRTGLVTVSLVSISYYMVGFPAHLEIDQVSVLFILVSMYFLLAAFDGNNLGISIIAGVMLGLSFLTKEIAILWLPLPLYLFLIISKWRNKQNFINLISYNVSFAVVAGIWWVYFYLTTGEIFLFSDRTSLGKYLLNAWGPLTISLSLVIILFLFYYIIRKRIRYFPTKLSDIYSSKKVIINNLLIKVSPWLLWILFTALFSISLSRMATWFTSIEEIPLRVTGFKYWAIIRILPEQPFLYHLLFPAIIIITIYLLFKRNHGDLVLFWYLLIFLPQLLTLSIEGQFVQPARYGMWLFWIGYLIVARCIVILLDFICNSFRIPELNKLLISNSIVIPIIGYGLWAGNMIPPTYNYQKYQSPSYHNAKPIQETSTWIKNNIPKDARLGSSVHYLSALNFYLEDQYEIYRWYALRNDRSNREWPFNREIELAINQDELVFQDRIRRDYSSGHFIPSAFGNYICCPIWARY